jgi:hypothetical protein
VADVKSAELEIHVLRPSQYEAPRCGNERGVQKNQHARYISSQGMIDNEGKRDALYAQVQALSLFSKARLAGANGLG